jgi:hypothetical protein
VTDRIRSDQAPRDERNGRAAEAAGADQGPVWLIALPTFACSVGLAGYILVTIASRLL